MEIGEAINGARAAKQNERILTLEEKVQSLEEFQENLLKRFEELLQTVDDLQLEIAYQKNKKD